MDAFTDNFSAFASATFEPFEFICFDLVDNEMSLDGTDLKVFPSFALDVFANIGANALSPCFTVFAIGSDLLAFATLLDGNDMENDIGEVVGTFTSGGDVIIGARVGLIVGSGRTELDGLFVGKSVEATGAEVGLFVGELDGESVAATGVCVGLFDGELVGASVAATGAEVGLFVGELDGESVAATGVCVGLFDGKLVGASVAATGADVGLFVGELDGESVAAIGAKVGACVGDEEGLLVGKLVGAFVTATGAEVGMAVTSLVGDDVGIEVGATEQNAGSATV